MPKFENCFICFVLKLDISKLQFYLILQICNLLQGERRGKCNDKIQISENACIILVVPPTKIIILSWSWRGWSASPLNSVLFDLLIRIRQIIIFIFILMIKSPWFKVLCQMYAHIYGHKHAEYLCPFANTLNDKSLWPNRLMSYDLCWKTR